QIFVIDDHHFYGQAKAMYRGQFLNVHLESAIAGNAKHARIRLCQLRPDSCGESKPHRAQSARRNKSPRGGRTVALPRPHLVLADVSNDDIVRRQAAEKFVEETHGWLRQTSGINLRALRPAG